MYDLKFWHQYIIKAYKSTKLINPDQTGFIPGRQGTNNIRQTLHLQSVAESRKKPSMLLSLYE